MGGCLSVLRPTVTSGCTDWNIAMQYRPSSKAAIGLPRHDQTQSGRQMGVSGMLVADQIGRSPEYAKVRKLV